MKKINLIFAFLIMLCAFSCQKGQNPNFTFEVSEIATNSAKISVSPKDKEMTYYWAVLSKMEYDEIAKGDDATYLKEELKYIEQEAKKAGVSVSDYLSKLLVKGDSEFNFDKLTVNKEYYVYAFGLNNDLVPSTVLYKSAFSTSSGVKLDIKVEPTDNSCKVSITPDDNKATYYFGVISKEEYEKCIDDNDVIVKDLEKLLDLALEAGVDYEEFVKMALSTGADSYNFTKLNNSTEYYAYAYGMTPERVITSAFQKISFSTKAWTPSDNTTFSLSADNVKATTFDIAVTPSNKNTRYYVSIASRQYYNEKLGSDPNAAAKASIAQANSYGIDWENDNESVYSGDRVLSVSDDLNSNLEAETDYVVFAFGVSANGEQTTAVAVLEQKTAKAAPSSNTFELSIGEVFSDGAEYEIKTANDDLFFAGVVTVEEVSGMSDEQIKEYVIEQQGSYIEWSLVSGDQKDTWVALDSSTSYYMIAFGYEGGQATTYLAKKEFTTKEAK